MTTRGTASFFSLALVAAAQIRIPGPGGGGIAASAPTPLFIAPINYHGSTYSTTTPFITITNDGTPTGTPVTPSVGEVIIVSVSMAQGSAITLTSCTDNQSPANTYSVDTQRQNAIGASTAAALASTKVTTSSGTFTITCTTTAGAYTFMEAARFSGLSHTFDGAPPGVDGSSTTVSCGTITPAAGEALVIAAAVSNGYGGSVFPITGTGSLIVPTNGTAAPSTSGGPYAVGGFGYQIVTSTSGSYSPQFAFGTNGAYTSCVSVGYR